MKIKKYQIEAKQEWESFEYNGSEYELCHLNVHEIEVITNNGVEKIVVTYGLHCFTKNDTEYTINVPYTDNRNETRNIDLERYELSKKMRNYINNIKDYKFKHNIDEKYFMFNVENNFSGAEEEVKVIISTFKEKRLLRIHVITCFFNRFKTLESNKKFVTIYKIIKDMKKSPRNKKIPKEAGKGKPA